MIMKKFIFTLILLSGITIYADGQTDNKHFSYTTYIGTAYWLCHSGNGCCCANVKVVAASTADKIKEVRFLKLMFISMSS